MPTSEKHVPQIEIPPGTLVLLLGIPGAGKSTFAARQFTASQVVSLDRAREWVSDSAADQSATKDAVNVAYAVLYARMARGLTTVMDATNLHARDRRQLRDVADAYGRPRIALVFDVPLELCQRQNVARDRVVPAARVAEMYAQFQREIGTLATEGFAAIHTIDPSATRLVIAPSVTQQQGLPSVGSSPRVGASLAIAPHDALTRIAAALADRTPLTIDVAQRTMTYASHYDHGTVFAERIPTTGYLVALRFRDPEVPVAEATTMHVSHVRHRTDVERVLSVWFDQARAGARTDPPASSARVFNLATGDELAVSASRTETARVGPDRVAVTPPLPMAAIAPALVAQA